MTFRFGHDSSAPDPGLIHSQRYLIALGSNLGDRSAHLRAAIKAVNQELGRVAAVAPFYSTAPVGAADQTFLNSALILYSDLEPETLLSALLAIECDLGRVRTVRWGNRTIDLDILLWQRRAHQGNWQSESWQSPHLQIPHPEMLNRDFVMIPAAAIASDWTFPVGDLTLAAATEQSGYHLPPPASSCLPASWA